jgi:serine phosphatase RsbU (regulator of sigma subunit)
VGLIKEANFTADRVQLEPGDTFILFSDGVTESEDREENQFGISGFASCWPAKRILRWMN